jgi:hypothetical protein
MKKKFGIIACLICLFFFVGITTAQEEMRQSPVKSWRIAEAEHIIMVKDRNYIVSSVHVDDGLSEEPLPASFNDLKVLSIVKITPREKTEGFWKAKR